MKRFPLRALAAVGLALTTGAAACSSSPTSPSDTTSSTKTGPSSYNITIRYIGNDATARQKAAVDAAVSRWQSVISQDVPDITGSAPANACFEGQPALNERIDDIVIYVEFGNIDGAGNVLGEAGPCYIRDDPDSPKTPHLPLIGHLELDQADLRLMEQNGSLDAVVLHEMGHILGIGTLWPIENLISGSGSSDPRFTGPEAIAAYHSLGGLDAGVPVEGTGEDGTRDGHWRESTFGNELMTGWINGTTNPMSAMTVASLRDLGYGANTSLASSYSFATSQRIVASNAEVSMKGAEYITTPKFLMDANGRTTVLPGVHSTAPWHTK